MKVIFMQEAYKIVPLKKIPIRNHIEKLFERARQCFINKKFSEAIPLMQEAQRICPRENLSTVLLNLALFHHLLGHQSEAESLYEQLDDTPAKLINYLAFCHRYFLYSKFQGGNVIENNPLQPICRHNEWNYHLATDGIAATPKQEIKNIFEERVLNDFYFKIGRPQEYFFRNQLADEATAVAENLPHKIFSPAQNRVGIYVNDIQRHKDTAFVYDVIEILQTLGYTVYIYFDNIFENKLVHLLPKGIILRKVINYGILGFNNLVVEDQVFALLDLTGNRLRTRLTSLSVQEKKVLSLDKIFLETPLLLRSEIYFGDPIPQFENNDSVAIIGDLKYLSDEELSYIGKTMPDLNLIFMSFAFCEKVCQKIFEQRLVKCGMNLSHCKLISGILPFKNYLGFLKSVSAVIITSTVTAAEFSEVIFVGTPWVMISQNPLLRKIEKAIVTGKSSTSCDQRSLKKMRSNFAENLKRHMNHIPANPGCEYLFNEELHIQYQNGAFISEVNMSCNGDLLIFSDVRGERC